MTQIRCGAEPSRITAAVIITDSQTAPNHALQRTAASRSRCSRCALWPPSLSFIRWASHWRIDVRCWLVTLRPLKVREVIKRSEADGWFLDRTRGSHRQYKHGQKRGIVTVAGKPADDLAPGTLNSILKQAGLK